MPHRVQRIAQHPLFSAHTALSIIKKTTTMKSFYSITTSILVLVITITACHRRTVATAQDSKTSASPVNSTYKDAAGNLHLLGRSTREGFKQAPFDTWFTKTYDDYSIDTNTANQLKPLLKNKNFVIFMGTWCGDSRREVPRMYKLLDYCGVKPGQIQLINVSNVDTAYKQSPGHEERGLYISRVPDLLVYDDKKEIGRIVETPVASLEKDLLAIADKKTYTPRYPGTAYLIGLFQSPQWMSTPGTHEQAAEQLRSMVTNWGELTGFGRVLLLAGETDRAIDAMRISTLLFPAEPGVYNYLATAYIKKGNRSAAKQCCEKVLQLQPGNQQATAMLDQLNRQ